LRSLIYTTAEVVSGVGFNYDFGWGVINPKALLEALP
jgi:hypothetical protein